MEILDIVLEIETPTLYHIHTILSLGISTSRPETMVELLKKLILDVENQLFADYINNRGTFKFQAVRISKPGELYIISVQCNFFESIQITS